MEGEPAWGKLAWQEKLRQSGVTSAYSAEEVAAVGDLKPLGTSPYPSWPPLALHCLTQNEVLCPGATSWKLATLAQGPSHPALTSLACPRPILPASLHQRTVQLSLLDPRNTLPAPAHPCSAHCTVQLCRGSHCELSYQLGSPGFHASVFSCLGSEAPNS